MRWRFLFPIRNPQSEMRPGAQVRNPATGGGCVGRAFVTFFLLAFLLMGCVFEYMMLRDFVRTVQTYSWTETACTIESSRVETRRDDDSPYEAAIGYRYDAAPRNRASSQCQSTVSL
ncbi:DUF3592 domain-containing protein [Candidatus Sumerlaeota bacterium]|nr:DUF3592 domain-containing protein [Candidatus Sumerlaeota bacterium]